MKSKKLVFFGAMSAILISAGAARADVGTQIASKGYVDAQNATISADLANKADSATTLAGYGITDAMTTTDINTALGTKADTTALDAKANTADLGALATKDVVGTADVTDANITKPKLSADVQASLDKADTSLQTADLSGYATTTALDAKADKSTTLSGYGITDAMTTTDINTALGTKADATAVDSALATKANTADLGALAAKDVVGTTDITDANVTKPKLSADVQASLDKADTSVQSADLSGYATTTQLDTKADQATTYTKTEVDTALGDKANTTDVNTALAVKADSATTLAGYGITDAMTTTDINTALGAKANTADLGTLAAKSTVETADITDANVTKPKLSVDVQATLDKADTALQTADLADYTTSANLTTALTTKEDTANKTDNITTDTGSVVKFPTVNAVQTYAIPKPTAECLGEQSQCVLAIDKSDGSIYWEDVATSTVQQ